MNQKRAKIMRDISNKYYPNPYHNFFPHAVEVSSCRKLVSELLGEMPERTSLRLGEAAAHDVGNGAIAQAYYDEYRAAKTWWDTLAEEGLSGNDLKEGTRNILGTILQERGHLKTWNEIYTADCDIGNIGAPYQCFLENSARLIIEQKPKDIIMSKQYIVEQFSGTLHGFFPFLLDISGNDKQNPFLSPEVSTILPHFQQNRDLLQRDLEDFPDTLVKVVEDEYKKWSGNTLLIER